MHDKIFSFIEISSKMWAAFWLSIALRYEFRGFEFRGFEFRVAPLYHINREIRGLAVLCSKKS